MDNVIIPYHTRDSFIDAFGRAVMQDKDIQNLAPDSPVSFIPSIDFRRNFETRLEHYIEMDHALNEFIKTADQILSPKKENHHDNNNINSAQCEQHHDSIIYRMDHALTELCYFIKVNEFIPAIGKKHGGAFCHLIEYPNLKRAIYTVYFGFLEDKDALLFEINKTIDTVFPVLESLRKNFTPDIVKRRKSLSCTDDFSRRFLHCREIKPRDMADRLEYLFIRNYKLPLGITPIRNERVRREIARMKCNPKSALSIYSDIKHGKLSHLFPGYVLSPSCRDRYFDHTIHHDLVKKTDGLIPRNGYVIG